MKNIELASCKQTKQQQQSVSIYWDYQNVPKVKLANYLLRFASLQGDAVVNRKAYSNWCGANKTKTRLENQKFDCINVPRSFKNAVDIKLCIDCSNDSSDIIILVTGDCYGQILLDELQGKGKKVIFFAQQGSVSKELIKSADKFYFVEELLSLVSNNTSIQTDGVLSYINYDDAVDCLIEAIKTAVNKGKHTTYRIIASLMSHSQDFPNYQGVSSIRKQDGTKFTRFKKFVAAVEKEGKIKLQNEEMLLV
ncbi:NYN domain-containing protein [Coleofasciculus sp. FACHB-712]|uniref:NYN domain-containing protein n=1 Tax=Coleofasciculus sp. FACHB-712 TaxID=2692789 RepID=UPI0016843A0A|nr:NYN domain-containing protein [Coleofasciculus sp. FACHB-712]MBD1942886.1 NYN domain-containing protein [Coleofasciculus sp. FACHB-712]